MRVLIVEPHATGHHSSYLRWLTQGVTRRGWNAAIVTTPEALAHPSMKATGSDFGGVYIHTMEDLSSNRRPGNGAWHLLLREFMYWRAFRRAAREVHAKLPVDAVILPYVDYCFHALAILGSPFGGMPWWGISMRLRVAQNPDGGKTPLPFKWRMADRVLGDSHLQALFFINPSVREVPASWLSIKRIPKLRYLADPAEHNVTALRSNSRGALGVADDDVVILVYGLIDERKGIDALLTILATRRDLSNYVVILAGMQVANVTSLLQTEQYAELLSQRRLVMLDHFLSDVEQAIVFAAADVVWLGYRNHLFMSGVLVLAARAGLPLVGTAEGEIGWLIKKNELGAIASIDKPEEVALALTAMLDPERRTKSGQRARSAFAHHTVETFGDTVLSALNSSSNPS